MRALPSVAVSLILMSLPAVVPAAPQTPAQEAPSSEARELSVIAGKSVILDSPVNIQRVSVANGDLAEALAVSPREVVVNGKSPGETSLIVWQQGGNRLIFDLTVLANTTRLLNVRKELEQELKGQDVSLTLDGEDVFLRGTVENLVAAERAVRIAGTLGKPVNLLNVTVPPTEAQILLKVRFANVDRGATTELGANILSTGALGTTGLLTTGQFSPPTTTQLGGTEGRFTLRDALNIFLFRPDLNLAATIRALYNKRMLEILAEPNVLTIDGKQASFLAGGEFPYPTLQGGGGGLGAVTIQFREFGVRIGFLPKLTPRGTIRLQVTPEVSSLDYANGLVFQGFTIPGLSTRRVQTEIELQDRQSFVIGGLLDNRVTETLSKIPGLGDIPFFGKLFQSKSLIKSNAELLVLVTVELVRPMADGQPGPEIKMPLEFLKGAPQTQPRTPGLEVTGPAPAEPPRKAIPVEQLIESLKPVQQQQAPAPAAPVQFVPVPVAPAPANPPAASPPEPKG